MSTLSITRISKQYAGHQAVRALSLETAPGELVGLLGPNGAGKTTTIRMVMNIIRPDSGAIRVLGQPNASAVLDRVGYLPEERGLYRKMTVEATLRYLGKLKGLRGTELRQRSVAALERVGLADWRDKRVEALSKGMQQKLQFVAATLHRPALVILDEPFSGLDPLNMVLLQELIAELRDAGTTVIFSTHVMEQAERLCDRIVLINRGRVLIDDTLTAVRNTYPARTVIVEGAGDLAGLGELVEVRATKISGQRATLELRDGADPGVVLAAAQTHARLTRFELRRPGLQEIFVHLVQQDATEGAA